MPGRWGKLPVCGRFYRTPRFDLERQADATRIRSDPDFFLSQWHAPIVLDEAQLYPDLFPALRVAIDEDRVRKGRYLFSGSSSPALLNS